MGFNCLKASESLRGDSSVFTTPQCPPLSLGCSFEVLLFPYCFKFKFKRFLLVLFACKDSSQRYESSKRRNQRKPENLGTIFLLSVLKVPTKSVTSYPAEIKYLEA